VNDTRLLQWAAILDEIRTEAHDMAGMLPSNDPHRIVLTALRRNVNEALDDIKRLEKL